MNVLEKVASTNNTTVEEVEKEISLALKQAAKTTDPDILKRQRAVFQHETHPSTEAVIKMLSAIALIS